MTRGAAVTLTVVTARLEPSEYVFDERNTCILGRATDCAPRLPNDRAHRTVSRHHCLLDINPPDVRIRDFGSLNGTYVNGVKIGQRERGQSPEEAAGVPYPEHDLVDGDEFRLGDTVVRVGVRKGTGPGPSPDACRRCGLDVSGEVDVCTGCRADPRGAVDVLLQQARRVPAGSRDGLAAIAGYTVVRELGKGGMGAVYLARHDATGAEVALKVMLPKVEADEEARARFLREIELTRKLRHANVASLKDAGCADGTFYFTTEFCAGGSMDQLIKRRGGRLPGAEAVQQIRQALAGLEYAHDAGVVHRDLSPHNILLADDGDGPPIAKIGDFGLAKAFDEAGLSGLTRTGHAAGKPWYMPRQQIIDFRNADPAVDVWAAAACLYRALTGTYPRDFPDGLDPWFVVLGKSAVPIRDRRPDVPAGLAEVIDHALTETPTIGYSSASAFRAALTAGPTVAAAGHR